MTEATLTTKQAYFLKRLQEADATGQTIAQLAEQENVSSALLYNYRYLLRGKGLLPSRGPITNTTRSESAFTPIATPQTHTGTSSDRMELKTQLPNGQPIWLSLS